MVIFFFLRLQTLNNINYSLAGAQRTAKMSWGTLQTARMKTSTIVK